MKQFFSLVLVAGALTVSAPSQARMVSSRAQCVAACDGNGSVSDNCSWITKRAKWTRCRAKLLQKCRRFGADAMCPAPPPPTTTTVPAPLVPTTTQPAPVVTTTTSPYIPPTTTTLPVVTYPNFLGAYEFDGVVTSDPCGIGIYGGYSLLFAVTDQVGSSLAGTIGMEYTPAVGSYYSDGSWGLSTSPYYASGCVHQFAIGVGSIYLPAYGDLLYQETCGVYTCTVEYEGTVY